MILFNGCQIVRAQGSYPVDLPSLVNPYRALADSSNLLFVYREGLSAANSYIKQLEHNALVQHIRYESLDGEYYYRRQRDSIRIQADSIVVGRMKEQLENRRVGKVTGGLIGFFLGVLATKF